MFKTCSQRIDCKLGGHAASDSDSDPLQIPSIRNERERNLNRMLQVEIPIIDSDESQDVEPFKRQSDQHQDNVLL